METLTRYRVQGRNKRGALDLAEPGDFELTEEGHAQACELSQSPPITPYCIDVERGRMLFVQTPEALDLWREPFLYQAQYRHAQHVFAIGLDALNRVAEALPDPENLLLVHSTGRCGSTLLANMFNQLSGVRAWSEPDVFTRMAMAGRPGDARTRGAMTRTLRSVIRLLCKSRQRLHVIKFRSVVIEHFELLAEAMPHAQQLFMYRDAIDVARSTSRILGMPLDDWRTDDAGLRGWARLAPLLSTYGADAERIRADHLLACLWAGGILRYLDTHGSASWAGALRYEDLTRAPQAALHALFAAYALESDEMAHATLALERDSQAGTVLEREQLHSSDDPLHPRHVHSIVERLRELRAGLQPDMILPASLGAP